MTAIYDQKTKLVRDLISSCHQAESGYRSAARAVEDESLRRLFEIYAQQRTRFAQELREYLPNPSDVSGQVEGAAFSVEAADRKKGISACVETDEKTLALYREALAKRSLPTRAQLVISAQLALMERVHDRVNRILDGGQSSPNYPGTRRTL